METNTIKHMIEQGLADCRAEVTGDGTHFEAIIVSPAFAGKNSLARHRMVYAALGEAMRSAIHALSMRTYTPDEHAAQTK
ncbi:MAG: BolA/IbaG family iron-sulfur metabolism protein [Gammaproteobacteria bacterium]|nr:MAG: BolA/IbaG family iron-sulfur metabolism protein [Gammaproteobacteria bacterium]